MEIHLSNATISDLQIDPQRANAEPFWSHHEIEQISFTFRKIEITNHVNNNTTEDDWNPQT